ncbi:MAG: hypothetical protein ACFHX7_14850 [Pseudomonadota bacterium]
MATESREIDFTARRRSRISLLVMASIAIVPLCAAYALFFFFPQFAPSGTTNQGTLIEPVFQVEALGLGGALALPPKWTLLMTSESACEMESNCAHGLYLARQINIALGKDAERLQRAFIIGNQPELRHRLESDYPEMLIRQMNTDRLLPALETGTGLSTVDGHLFLVDPNGNVIMFYTPDQDGKAILKDLKHLLKLSNIG